MSYELQFDVLRSYDPGDSGITVPVTIELNSISVNLWAKIDTGSTFCIFRRAIGEDLGIEIESGNPKTIATATGTFLVFGHNVKLCTVEIEFDSEVFFAADESFDRNLLGRYGWLNRMIVGIKDYDVELYLSQYR